MSSIELMNPVNSKQDVIDQLLAFDVLKITELTDGEIYDEFY